MNFLSAGYALGRWSRIVPFSILLGCRPVPSSVDSDLLGGDSSTASRDSVPAGTWDLVDPTAFTILEAGSDPYADHRPADVSCDPTGLIEEVGTLEVDTGICAYVSASQPSLAAVRAGDLLEVLVFHDSLRAKGPAMAHVALALEGVTVWESLVAIPSASDIYSATAESPVAIEPGGEVVFHLHNHGTNRWNLGHFRVAR